MEKEYSFTESRLLLLELQNEELEASLNREEEAHRKATQRAAAYERRNKNLRAEIEKLKDDLRCLSHCWSCPDLGNHEQCKKCSNGAIMVEEGERFLWRGFLEE